MPVLNTADALYVGPDPVEAVYLGLDQVYASGPLIRLTGRTVAETATVGTTVGTLSVANATGTPVFTLTDSAGGKFAITGTTLKTNAALDYETATFHTITVHVTGMTPTTADRTFIVLVTDVVEPVIALAGTSISESASIGAIVGTLSIANAYTGTPVFTLPGSSGGKFAVSGNNLTVAGALDFETAASHSITVAVSGITPAAANKPFTITVTDVLELDPVLQLTGTTVNEDAAVNTTVGTISLTGTYTGSPVYTLADSAGGKFNISGALLRVNAALDYETATTHGVTVAVSGITPAAANKAFTVVVNDVTESVGVTAPPTTGLWGWWDAEHSYTQLSGTPTTLITTDGTGIGSQIDRSGNGRHVYSGGGSTAPVYKTGILNSLPAARYLAANLNKLFTTGGGPTGNSFSMYVVVNRTAIAQPYEAIICANDGSATSSRWGVLGSGTGGNLRAFNGGDGAIDAMSATAYHLVAATVDNTGAFPTQLKVDNNTTVSANAAGSGVLGEVAIGAYFNGFWTGDIVEVLLYTTVHTSLTSGDGLIARQYLDTRYNLGLGLGGGGVVGTTFNPSDKSSFITLSPDNLTATVTTGAVQNVAVRATVSKTTGKYFCKFTIILVNDAGTIVGIMNAATGINNNPGYPGGADAPGHGVGYARSGPVFLDNGTYGGFTLGPIEAYTTGDVISMAVDLTAERIWFRKNSGNWNNDAAANPATGVNGLDISNPIQGDAFFPCVAMNRDATAASVSVDFSGTGAPSGFDPWGGGVVGTTKNIVSDYGAVGDAQWAQATLSITTNTLTSATAIWPSATLGSEYIGKTICVGQCGGGAGEPQGGTPLLTTITGWTSATSITLAANCVSALASAPNIVVAWGTLNNTAFTNFRTAYQGQTVTLTIPAGKYLVHGMDIFDGIRNITVNGTGAHLCGSFRFVSQFQYQVAGHSGLTQSVSAGSTSVQLITPSDVSKFVIGNYAMMGAFETQGAGYPTNQAVYEFLKIVAIDSDSGSPNYGRVTFSTPLEFTYLSTWPMYQDEDFTSITNQRYSGPGVLYASPPQFDHTSVVNGVTVAVHAQAGVSGRSHTFNNCVFNSIYGPFPSVSQSVVFNGCTGTLCRMEVDKLVDQFTMTATTWGHLGFQSAGSIKSVTLDGVTLVDGIVGSPAKLTLRNSCVIHGPWQLASVFFGYPKEVNVSDSIVDNLTIHPMEIRSIEGGSTGGSGDGIQLDTAMIGNVIPVPATMRKQGVSQWAITGNRLFFTDPNIGTVGRLTITDVKDSITVSGGIDIVTDWPTGHFPARTYGSLGLWLTGHPAPICSFSNVTGCQAVVDLSNVPAGPMWARYKRTFDKSFTGTTPGWNVTGKIRIIRVTVTTAYGGPTGTVAISVFPGFAVAIGGDGSQVNNTFGVNLKVAGVRELDVTADSYPKSWTGAQSGDTLPSAQTAALWACGNLQVTALHNISAEVSALAFSVEVITDQGF